MNMKLVSMLVVSTTGLLALAACDSGGGGGAGGGTGALGGLGGSGVAGMGGGPPSGAACNDFLTTDFSGWPGDAEMATDFATMDGFNAYDALNSCACGTGTPCSLVCNDPAHPSFCAGMAPVAGGMCITCLQMAGANGCGDELSVCTAN